MKKKISVYIVEDAAKFNKIGVGLGLYLSKQIIDAHNGEIYAKSFENNHNVFGFVIPLTNDVKKDFSESVDRTGTR